MNALQEQVPFLDLDLFSDASLQDPFPTYRCLREAGAVVRLRRPDVYALGRFADVQAALRAPKRLISGEGVGFNDLFNARKGMNVLQSDGELHARLRSTVMRPLLPAKLVGARVDLKRMISERVRALTGKGWFDGMKGLASFLPMEAIAHLVGLPDVGRERMLDWAAATFNVIGPDQATQDLAVMVEARDFMATLDESAVREGSWAGELFAAARTGRLSLQEAMAAISAYVIPSLDTTILAKGHLLNDLATHPKALQQLREAPDLVSGAVLESVRRHSVLRWFSRVAIADYLVEDAVIPAGARVMLLYGCANRDERRYPDPDRFDITRDARDQLAWGTGAHMCAGMHLARLEMEVLTEALLESSVSIEVGVPTPGLNRGLFGYAELPLRLERR
jgi:cytochrome P450